MLDRNSKLYKGIRKTGNKNTRVIIKDFFLIYYLFKT